MHRRRLLSAATALTGLGLAPSVVAQRPALMGVRQPEAMARIAAGGPTSLLGLDRSGSLWALSSSAEPLRLVEDLDVGVPLALGHGRIAARRKDGALWVRDTHGASVSDAPLLAPWAGLLVLPQAIIGLTPHADQIHLARWTPAADGAWRLAQRSALPVLPDARPFLADLDGRGDGGHIVVLAGPDGERYGHGVLGDAIEATRLVWLERQSLQVLREQRLETSEVWEDIAPRPVSLGAVTGLIVVRAGPQGAQMVLLEADRSDSQALRVAAEGPVLGQRNRWMSPIIAPGRPWLAVHTPHIGGVLHAYVREGDQLRPQRLRDGLSNHRIGSRELNLAVWSDSDWLWLPDQSGQRLLALHARDRWKTHHEQAFKARIAATVSYAAGRGLAVLLDDGQVYLGRLGG